MDTRDNVAGLRADFVRAQPVVPSHVIRVCAHTAGRRLGPVAAVDASVLGAYCLPSKNLFMYCYSFFLQFFFLF